MASQSMTATAVDFSKGLRDLADVLDAHPEIKQPYDSYRHNIYCPTGDLVTHAMCVLGGGPWKICDSDDYVGYECDLGNGVRIHVYTRITEASDHQAARLKDPLKEGHDHVVAALAPKAKS